MLIASFYTPREARWGLDIVGYHRCLRVLDDSCKRLGLRHVVLSDSERTGFETALYPLPENLMQAFLSAQMQLLETATEPVLLTGADCILTADPRPLLEEDFDVAITVGPFRDCRMNSGMIIVRDGPKAAKIWRAALESNPTQWGDDQTSLYRAILASDLKVKELPCQRYNWAPESPDDPAGMPMIAHFRGNRKGWMRMWYERFVIGEPPPAGRMHFKRGGNVEIDALMEHVRVNVARDLPWFTPGATSNRPLIIVGGAPSLRESLPHIHQRRSAGAKVWALNNAWRPLVAARIKPHAIVMMDARPENVEFVQDGPDCEYLIASMAHPSLFEALERQRRRVTVWHADQTGYAEREALAQYDKPQVIVPGGGTVGLRAMMLAPLAGHRDVHIYGMDSSYRGDQHHAYPQALNDGETVHIIHHTGLKKNYHCAGWMARQADEFATFRTKLVAMGVRIWVHGEGLIPDLSRLLNRMDRKEGIAA